MKKVLITGFRHSGTTMLMQLLRAHNQVGWIEFEEGYIEFDKDRKWVLMNASRKVPDLKKYVWGEKIPWGTREDDINGKRAIGFIKKWLEMFEKDARVIHILRHPFDVALSTTRGSHIGDLDWKYITTSVPKIIDYLNKKDRCATIIYEELVTNPEKHLENIFKFLDIKCDKKTINKVINTPLKFGKINSDRAFAFRNKKIDKTFDYESLIGKVKKLL